MTRQTVVDTNLAWGDCDLTPDLVSYERKSQPWHKQTESTYGPERLVAEGDDGESIYDISGATVPSRAMILRRIFENHKTPTPWKSWFESPRGNGWIVVTESGWKFFHQDFR